SGLPWEARRKLVCGVNSWSAGSGVGPDFCPGVPEDAPDGWAFLHAHGFEPTGEMADLIADIARFQAPGWVFSRVGGEVRFELAPEGDVAQFILLPARLFPNWTAVCAAYLLLRCTALLGP